MGGGGPRAWLGRGRRQGTHGRWFARNISHSGTQPRPSHPFSGRLAARPTPSAPTPTHLAQQPCVQRHVLCLGKGGQLGPHPSLKLRGASSLEVNLNQSRLWSDTCTAAQFPPPQPTRSHKVIHAYTPMNCHAWHHSPSRQQPKTKPKTKHTTTNHRVGKSSVCRKRKCPQAPSPLCGGVTHTSSLLFPPFSVPRGLVPPGILFPGPPGRSSNSRSCRFKKTFKQGPQKVRLPQLRTVHDPATHTNAQVQDYTK
jgi:hypothetical protein